MVCRGASSTGQFLWASGLPSASAWHPCLCSLCQILLSSRTCFGSHLLCDPPTPPQPTISKWSSSERQEHPLCLIGHLSLSCHWSFLPLSGLPMGTRFLKANSVYSPYFPRHLDQGPAQVGHQHSPPRMKALSPGCLPGEAHSGGSARVCGLDGGALHTLVLPSSVWAIQAMLPEELVCAGCHEGYKSG